MTTRKRPDDVLRDLCAQVFEDDLIDARTLKKPDRPSQSVVSRKDRQLCKQVRRAVEAALASLHSDPVVSAAEITEVFPAPDASRLRIVFQLTEPGITPEQASARFAALRPWLRAHAAAGITRKRVPELVLDVLPLGAVPELDTTSDGHDVDARDGEVPDA